MFKGLRDLTSLVKNARQIGDQMKELNEKLKGRRVTGTAGGGMVEIDLNGLLEVLRCKIDEQLIIQHDRELIEDLVAVAINQAIARGKELHADAMKELTGGLNLPGLDEVMAKVTEGEEPMQS